MVHNLLLLLASLCALLPLLLALPITSKPYARSPDHLVWDTYGGGGVGVAGTGYGDDSLEPSDGGYGKPKKILPKSIFIAPTLQNSIQSTCGPGSRPDHQGNCIQTFQVDHNQLLLDQLNLLLATHQSHQKDEDVYDYDYEFEATSPSTKETQKGPFQLSIPVQLEIDVEPPQAQQSTGPIFGSTSSSWDDLSSSSLSSSSAPIAITTTERPKTTLTNLFENLFTRTSKDPLDPFGLKAKYSTSTPITDAIATTTPESVPEETEGTTNLQADEENTTSAENTEDYTGEVTSPQDDFIPSSLSTNGEWNRNDFGTELAEEQLVPVTTTSDTATTLTTSSDDDDVLSNTEGTTLVNEENIEVATERRDKTTSSSNQPLDNVVPTTTETPEVTETVLPYRPVEDGAGKRDPYKPIPTISTILLPPSRGIFDWQGSGISIVTPVPNPFPFGGSRTTFKQPPPFRFSSPLALPTTTTRIPTTTEAQSSHEILGVENESENSQKLRESLIESEQKEVNYETIDVNNRFIYHHLNGSPTTAALSSTSPVSEDSSSLSPSTSGVQRLSTETVGLLSTGSSTTDRSTSLQTKMPTFAEKLAALLRPKESERRVAFSSFAQPPTTTTTSAPQTTTPLRFGDFIRSSSSNRVRFPGPSVNRQPQPNKLIPNGRSGGPPATSDDNKEKKPFWWFPSGWEVDTKQKEKPILLRFWSKMPLIPDNVASQRRSSDGSRNNRENSKSPSENLYREVAFQDISKVFQGRQLNSEAVTTNKSAR